MSVLSNIRTVAKYESKLLRRSWFYRTFLFLAVVSLTLLNIGLLITEGGGGFWMLKAIESNIAYFNLLLLNTGQAVVAVFLSSEFLKSERKLDTSEVFYVHPLSNAEYLAGKIWGNLKVFFRLDLLMIALVIVMNLISDFAVDWASYAIYFLIICVPTLIYIFGLSVGLMLILKNQAITFVLLLGYIALTLFYVQDKFYYVFDYMVYSLPLTRSSIVGFTNWEALTNHRCIYLLLGLGFLSLSVFLFQRLPNTKYGRYRWLVYSVVFLAAGVVAARRHIASILKEADMRTLYTEINNRYVHAPKMVVESYDIRVEQHPETVSSEVVMKGIALEAANVYTFCLNPSLTVREVKEGDRDLSFTREHQIIQVDFGRRLSRGDTASFALKYDGRIDPLFCYLDIPAKVLQKEFDVELFRIDKAYSFQQSNYVLFTPETYWYPRPGTAFSSESPDWQQAYFSRFRLTVKTLNGLRALSQGTQTWPLVKKRAPAVPRKKQPEGASEASEGDSVQVADTVSVEGELTAARREQPSHVSRTGASASGTYSRPVAERGRGGATQRRRGNRPPNVASGFAIPGGKPSQRRESASTGESTKNLARRGDAERRRDSRPTDAAAASAVPDGKPQQRRENAPTGEAAKNPGQDGSREVRRNSTRRRNPERINHTASAGSTDEEQTPAADRANVPEPETGENHSGEVRRRNPEGTDGVDSAEPADRADVPEPETGENHSGEVRRRNPEETDGVDSTGGPADRADASEAEAGEDHREGEPTPQDAPKDNLFIFETDFPAPSLTLIIGDYEQKSIEVDSTEYSVWHLRGNDYFSSFFDAIADTLPAQIRERRNSIESAYSLNYSFKRFSLVEVPVQFYGYTRTWTQAQELMQPEMILLPEKGCLMRQADFAQQIRRIKQEGRWNRQDINDEEAALRALNRFLEIFQSTTGDWNWSQYRASVNIAIKTNPYLIFPQLYNFRYNIFSSEWPIANRVVELYVQEYASDENNWLRQMNGISSDEKANLLMEQRSFGDLLSDTEQRDLLNNVIALKASSLFAPAECNIGYREYRDSLRALLQRNIFTNLRFENLLDTMGALAGEDLITPLRSWNDPTPLPAYIVGAPEVTHVSNRNREAYIMKMQVTNDSDHDGIIHIETRFAGRDDLYDPRAKRKVSLSARETKQLVSVWNEAPRDVLVNTLISANLPNRINRSVGNIVRAQNRPIDSEGDFVVRDVSFHIPGEVIVDNEDSLLFALSAPDAVGLLPRWLDRVDNHSSFRYSGVFFWRPPLQWTLTTSDKYYGIRVRSAYVIKSGSGSQTATWTIPVPSEGPYNVYYYVSKPEDNGFRVYNSKDGDKGPEYHFKVNHDGDEEHAYINMKRADEGWSLLGTYYFSADTVRVTLTNDCKLRSTIADAVKIVRR